MSIHSHQFKSLHDHYGNRLLNSMTAFTGNRSEAEDITAAAFATAFEMRERFRGDSSLYTWVHAIAVNEARSRLRRRQPVSLDSIEGPIPQELIEPDALAESLHRAECRSKLRNALRQVPAASRQILVDHVVRGYSVKSIARMRRLPLGTVLSRIHSAKRCLRAAWGV